MVPPLAADLLLFARALLLWPVQSRSDVARRLIAETEVAYRHWLLHGTVHPAFGDGSLVSRALLLSPRPEPMASDPDYLQALETLARVIRSHSHQ